MTPGQQYDAQVRRNWRQADRIFAKITQIRKADHSRWDDLEGIASELVEGRKGDARVLTLKFSLIQNEREAKKIIRSISICDRKIANLLEKLADLEVLSDVN